MRLDVFTSFTSSVMTRSDGVSLAIRRLTRTWAGAQPGVGRRRLVHVHGNHLLGLVLGQLDRIRRVEHLFVDRTNVVGLDVMRRIAASLSCHAATYPVL